MAEYESTLHVFREVHMFKIPPRASSKGYKAADWDVNSFLWTGRLRIASQGPRLFLKFEQPNGDLFAVCPYDPKGNSVEPVLDSSRYFVVRLESENGQHVFVGLGFQERSESFDFNVTIQDHFKHLDAEKHADERIKQWEAQPKQDFSLKEGQTLSINIKSIGTKAPSGAAPAAATTGGTSGAMLPPPPGGRIAPPPSRASAPAATTASAAPAASVWGDFEEFQSAPAPGGSGQPAAGGAPASGFGGWTTF